MEEFILIEKENIYEENSDGITKKPDLDDFYLIQRKDNYSWIKEYFREIRDLIANLNPDDILSLLELGFPDILDEF